MTKNCHRCGEREAKICTRCVGEIAEPMNVPDVGPAFFRAVDEMLTAADRTKGSTRCTCQNLDGLRLVCTRCQLHEAAAKVRNFLPTTGVHESQEGKATT